MEGLSLPMIERIWVDEYPNDRVEGLQEELQRRNILLKIIAEEMEFEAWTERLDHSRW